MSQSYTAKITKNSLWATFSFIIASLCNFAISIAITRYFGKEIYGQYSYFLWLSGIMGIVAGFGFQQTLTKFLPKYFFQKKDPKSPEEKTKIIFQKLLAFQIYGSIIIAILCIVGIGFFENLIKFHQDQKGLLLIITFLSIVPVSLNTFLNSSFSALQEFQKLSRISIITSVINLVLVIIAVATQQNLTNFLWLYGGINLLSSILLLFKSRQLLKKPKGKNAFKEKLFSYSAYAYVSIVCTQIVWERSEIFFLGMFSNSDQIALYTLSYSLAVLFISVWGPLNSVMNSTTSEVVATEKQDKLMMITQHGTKYLAIIILPLALIASLFIGDVVSLVYGKNFQDVALLFPFLVLSHCIAVIITPAGSIPMLKQEMKKSMFFNIGTAAINIVLDYYLIVKYQAVGAMLANVISQFFSIGLSLMNAKKYKLGIFNPHMVKVFFLNALIAGLFIIIFPLGFFMKFTIALLAMLFYMILITKIAFNKNDVTILSNLKEIVPKKLQPIFSWFLKQI